MGSGLTPDRTHGAPRLALLRGQLGLSVRLTRAVDLGWILALAVTGLIFGLVARGAGNTLAGSSVQQVLDKLGATGGGAGAYLGVVFLIVAALVGFAAAGQIGAARDEEAQGRLDHLLVRPLARTRWLAGRLCVALLFVVACGVVAGFFTLLGTATQHTAFGAASLLSAGVNAAVPAVLVLGIGAFLFGLWPRAAAAGVYAVLAWSLLVELVGGIGAASHWLLDTSVFHHVASAPAVPVDWAADGLLTAGAGVAALIGAGAFARRDLQGA